MRRATVGHKEESLLGRLRVVSRADKSCLRCSCEWQARRLLGKSGYIG